MQISEFLFNPKNKQDVVFDSYIFEPENIFEKPLGSLCIVGEIRNAMPNSSQLLDNLAKIIKQQYYTLSQKSSETALKKALREANKFLNSLSQKGNIHWLGNLNFAVLTIAPKKKIWKVNFTKTGNIKILLSRGEEITEISKNLEIQNQKPGIMTTTNLYRTQQKTRFGEEIFVNIATGKLIQNDKIMIFTKDIFDCFSKIIDIEKEKKTSILTNLSFIDKEKETNDLFKKRKGFISETSGILLLALLSAKNGLKNGPKIFNFEKEKGVFFKEAIKKLKFTKFPEIKFPEIKKLKRPRFSLNLPQPTPLLRKNIILISLLLLILLSGFLVFRKEKEAEINLAKQRIKETQSITIQAEKFLILKDEEKANALLQDALKEILPLTEKKAVISKEATALKNSIEKELYLLNKLEIIEEPKLFFELPKGENFPQKFISQNSAIYLFNPSYEGITKIEDSKLTPVMSGNQKFTAAIILDDNIIFFSKPNKLFLLKDKELTEIFSLDAADFVFDDFSCFNSNLYFLDSKGIIIKCPHLKDLEWGEPQNWSKPGQKIDAKSMAIDGNVWLLTKDDKIERYFLGVLAETLESKIFPKIEKLEKIYTSPTLSELYILEPAKNRLIVLNKAGKIIKQFQSKKFDNLKDFYVSKNGKTIYLLNNLKIYQINL